MNSLEQLKEAVKDLYLSVEKLNSAFPDRKFTPDGRMVGDIGEALAALKFNVKLDEKSRKHWDGHRMINGKERKVQIKTTQKDGTYLKEPPHDGDLMVFKIERDGGWELCYDGPIRKVWNFLKNKNSTNAGEKFITLKGLKKIEK